jgi:hypothetical protein
MNSSAEDNLRVLPVAAGRRSPPADALDLLRRAVAALELIADGFGRIVPDPHWSSGQWGAASVAFYVRLPDAEQEVAGLRRIDPADWPEVGWSAELATARDDFERELRVAVRLLGVLLRPELPAAERAWQAQRFTAGGKGLTDALRRLQVLIVGRYPELRQRP